MRKEEQRCQNAANDRPNHGDRGIRPVTVTFVFNREKAMCDSWTEIPRGIDRIPRCSTQRQTNREDDQADG